MPTPVAYISRKLEPPSGWIEFRNMEAWSSLHALLFIARINEEEGVMLSSSDLAGCKHLEDIYQLILSK